MLRENWIRVEGPLADGTDLTEEVTELMRKRTYLNRNGKRKSKIRSRYLLTVRAAYPQDRYGTLNSSTIAAHEAVRLPAQAVLRDARASEKDIRIKAVANAPQDIANTIAMMSLGAYRILNRPRRGDAA